MSKPDVRACAVVTAIAGRYDKLMRPNTLSTNTDYLAFVDRPASAIEPWQGREFPMQEQNANLRAKAVKVLPHRWLANYEYSIWLDGNIVIRNKLDRLLDYVSDDTPIAMFSHPEGRETIEEEAKACIELRKETAARVNAQLKAYYDAGFDNSLGRVASGFVIIRKHNHPSCVEAMEEWWANIMRFTRRDQISWPYVVWKTGVHVNIIPFESEFHNYFERIKHRGIRGRMIWVGRVAHKVYKKVFK